jgi:Predicted membrane protein
MVYEILMYLHLATVVPCVFLGAYLLLAKKGGLFHQKLGAIYMVLMIITAILALFLEARVGPVFLGHFGWIHLFCFLVLWTVPTAFLAIRKGKVKSHQRKMVLLYIGAILIAGGFTFSPGRFLHELFF